MENGLHTQASTQALLETSGGGIWDFLVVGVVILVAIFYLYRKLWLRRGACSGCASSKAGCAATCSTSLDEATPLRQPAAEEK